VDNEYNAALMPSSTPRNRAKPRLVQWVQSATQSVIQAAKGIGGGAAARPGQGPRIVSRDHHCVSRAQISPNALKVLYRLNQAGYDAYLVGGGVRDLLLEREPKDFDVATSATPEQVRDVFRNCRLIGRRFRLAHVHFGQEIIEVATFRRDASQDDDQLATEDGQVLRDNVYGSLEDDAFRRDFSINALYYDVRDFTVVDYCGGMADLEAGTLRLIGDPEQRYREDPVRMLRAIRFAVKLGFRLEKNTEAPIRDLSSLLANIPPARLFEEVLKLFHAGQAAQSFEALRHYDLFQYLFPQTDRVLSEEEEHFPHIFVARALENTDLRIAEGMSVNPAFLFAAILWEPVRQRIQHLISEGQNPVMASKQAGAEILSEQRRHVTLLKRFAFAAQEIWELQMRFDRRRGKQAERLFMHPRFRAAYDFLLLRAEAGEPVEELAAWWTQYQNLEGAARETYASEAPGKSKRRKRRRRKSTDASAADAPAAE
jgi:poly(A) polymerase